MDHDLTDWTDDKGRPMTFLGEAKPMFLDSGRLALLHQQLRSRGLLPATQNHLPPRPALGQANCEGRAGSRKGDEVNMNQPIKSRSFEWKPQPDITAFELAQCMDLFFAGITRGIYVEMAYSKLPPECKRHWEVRES